MKRVAFYCQHVLGIGHLVRSTEILRALCREFSVLLIGGGRPVEGFPFPRQVEIVNLPALETDADFGNLQPVSGAGNLEAIQRARKDMLLSVLERFAPHAFIAELFPFGRKRFAFELIPALEKVRGGYEPAKVVCSLRDILVVKRDQAAHEERVCGIVNRYFDEILVHSDPRFQRLEGTFSRVADLRCAVRYTGYVVGQACASDQVTSEIPAEPFVIVTIGSGRYKNGHRLLRAVIEVAPLLRHRLVIFAGPFIPDDEFDQLKEMAAVQRNVQIGRYTPDLHPFLRRAELSISMGGYNTIMNILSARTRAIVFPYTANDDQEQYIRAEKLQALGVIEMLHTDDLQPHRLAAVVNAALQKEPASINWRMNGAEQSARAIRRLLQSHNRVPQAVGA